MSERVSLPIVADAVDCKCGELGGVAECPFNSEINDDYTPCTCCASCRHECAMEI